MGLFGGLGKLFNSVTAPVGVKLFSGGPYADRGMGDKAQGQIANMEEIAKYLQQIAMDPSSPLNLRQGAQDIYARMGQFDLENGQQDPQSQEAQAAQMGALRDTGRYREQAESQYGQDSAGLQGAVNSYDQMQSRGLQPLEGVAAQFPELLKAYMKQVGVNPDNPYGQTEAEGIQRNSLQNKAAGDKQAALAQLRARFAQRGISNPAAMAAAEARINQMYDTGAMQSTANFDEQARQGRATGLQNAMSQMFQGAGLQQNQFQSRLAGAQQNVSNRGSMMGQRAQGLQDLYGLASQRASMGGQIAGQREGFKQNRLNNMQTSIGNRQNLYGMGQNALNSAGNMFSGNANQFQQLGNAAENRQNNAYGQIGGLAGMIFGGGLGNQSGFGQLGAQRNKKNQTQGSPATFGTDSPMFGPFNSYNGY